MLKLSLHLTLALFLALFEFSAAAVGESCRSDGECELTENCIRSICVLPDTVVEKQGEKFILKEATCDQVVQSRKGLESWLDLLNLRRGHKKATSSYCRSPIQSTGTKCEVDISTCIPDSVVALHGQKDLLPGPNCYNHALVMSEILPSLRFSTDKELQFYLSSPLCRELKRGETRQPGDLGVILSNGNPEHVFIYVSPTLVFSKNGQTREAQASSPYALQSLDAVERKYEVKVHLPECQEYNNPYCGRAYYRCQPMMACIQASTQIARDLIKYWDDITAFESLLEERILKKTPFLPFDDPELKKESDRLISPFLLNSLKDEREQFVVLAIRYRLESIYRQLEKLNGLGVLSQKAMDFVTRNK